MTAMLTIIVPVFNEAATVEEVLRRVKAASTPGFGKEMIVVDDGSTDGTPAILGRLRDELGFLLIRHDRNRGKGAAIRTALKQAGGAAVLIQDADLEYDPADYQKLLAVLEPGTAAVYGSRYLGQSGRGRSLFGWGGRFLTWWCNLLFGAALTDINTCYKLFRADVIKDLELEADGFEFCEEATAKVLRSGRHIKEVPVSYRPRGFAEGKKIRLHHGWRGFLTLARFRFKKLPGRP